MEGTMEGTMDGTLTTACGSCGKLMRSDAVLYTAAAVPVCTVCYARADIAATQERAARAGSSAGRVGVVASIIPLLFHVTSTSAVTVNGEVVGTTFRDWIAIGCGPITAVCGVAAIVAARSRASGRWLVIGAVLVVVGAYHLARGFGVVG
jgi:cytochrome bd-type quinol oxidase subunit 2